LASQAGPILFSRCFLVSGSVSHELQLKQSLRQAKAPDPVDAAVVSVPKYMLSILVLFVRAHLVSPYSFEQSGATNSGIGLFSHWTERSNAM
jgi:hypothetical protein